jgi:hypothetical protein
MMGWEEGVPDSRGRMFQQEGEMPRSSGAEMMARNEQHGPIIQEGSKESWGLQKERSGGVGNTGRDWRWSFMCLFFGETGGITACVFADRNDPAEGQKVDVGERGENFC